MPPNCTLKSGYDGKFYVILCFLPQLKIKKFKHLLKLNNHNHIGRMGDG